MDALKVKFKVLDSPFIDELLSLKLTPDILEKERRKWIGKIVDFDFFYEAVDTEMGPKDWIFNEDYFNSLPPTAKIYTREGNGGMPIEKKFLELMEETNT